MKQNLKSNFNATRFFELLTKTNKLACEKEFQFCQVSGLEGFEEALASMQNTANFVCVSDIANGYMELNTSPHCRRVKTVFFAMRHAIDDMEQRNDCFHTMQELFRQFMSKLILQKTLLENNFIYLEPRITFNEIDRYFFSGCACAYFQVATMVHTDLRHQDDEWYNEAFNLAFDECFE